MALTACGDGQARLPVTTMRSVSSTPRNARIERTALRRWLLRTTLLVVGVSVTAVEPVLAQTTGEAFCDTAMAETTKNLFTLIQFGGPLIGGVIALGATIVDPIFRGSENKRELKATRNQAVFWGLLVAPLATTIVQFLLNNVVVGGASCGF